MLISIITPVYNTRKYLERCIRSVQNQTFKVFEHIIVDDGSTDGSGRVCDDYAMNDSRIQVIHQQNCGQGNARNTAIKSARGDYLVFLDSDDFIGEGLLEYLINIIAKYVPEMIIYNHFGYNERSVRKYTYSQQESINEEILNREKLWKKFLNRDKSVNGMIGNKCISKKLLIENKLFFPEIYAREDAYFLSQLFQYVNHVVLTDYMGYYQIIRYGSTEQQPFTKNFLVSISISENNMTYIRDTFPKLYEAAYRSLIVTKISCLRGIATDKKSKIYITEKKKIQESLKADIESIKKMGFCEDMLDKIVDAVEETKIWKKENFISLVKIRLNRIKRFLYGKVF